MPLETLYVPCCTKVADLSPLKGMRLRNIRVHGTLVDTLEVFRGMPVETIGCDFVPERDTMLLKSMKSLQQVNDTPIQDFWKRVA